MIRESSSREVKSVRTGFGIIDHLQNHDGAGLEELARHLDLAKSTVHNYLATLESMGYVVKRDGDYHLGLRFLTHGMAAKSGLRAREGIADSLADLAADADLPAWWVIEEHGRGIFVESAIPDGAGRVYGRVGKRSYLHTHAAGKAILAALPDGHRERVLETHGLPEHTNRTVTDAEALEESVSGIETRGYAIDDGEAALGVRSVGAAFEGPGERYHGICVFGYSHDFSLPPDRELITALERTIKSARDLLAGGEPR